MANPEVFAIRKSADELQALIGDLDSASDSSGADLRTLRRYSYRDPGARAAFQQPGGEWHYFRTPTRDLSQGGACILVSRFVYPGTLCRLELRTIHNNAQWISSKVVRCRYLPGTASVYEAGLLFDEPIDAGMFHREATSIRLLYCGSDDAALLGKLLAGLNCEFMTAESQDACEPGQWEFDVGLFDMDGEGGVETVRTMRSKGCMRALVGLSAAGIERRDELLEAGCDDVCMRPLSRVALRDAIMALKEEPLPSTLVGDSTMAEAVDSYAHKLHSLVPEMEKALGANDSDQLHKIVFGIKGTAGSFGFQVITEAAAKLATALDEKKEASELRPCLRELVRMCLAARPATATSLERGSSEPSKAPASEAGAQPKAAPQRAPDTK